LINLDKNTRYLFPNWPGKPDNVHAYTTLRGSNNSKFNGYGEFNLATHVGDDSQAVESNRLQLIDDLRLPSPPVWLDQIHSDKVIYAGQQSYAPEMLPKADAIFSSEKDVVCAVLTADCLPVFFCNQSGTEIAVAHAGWRGLHAGVLSKTIENMKSAADKIFAYLGPAIGPKSFEVGEDIFYAFIEKNSANQAAFIENKAGHYLCDIYQLARIELQSMGVTHIDGGDFCTFSDERFYSYRKQKITGRMASLIWLDLV
jgi:YfiH family protein